jgi:hypothetical protein
MDKEYIKELSTHICRATAECMKTYLGLAFTIGFAFGIAFLSILILFLKG